eukprot:15474349-Alexandrium_andersonii.AAC.1
MPRSSGCGSRNGRRGAASSRFRFGGTQTGGGSSHEFLLHLHAGSEQFQKRGHAPQDTQTIVH